MQYIDDYGTCQETCATLCIYQEDLDPQELNKLLGVKATKNFKRGEVIPSKQKVTRYRRFGGWFLESKGRVESRDSRRHIDWILAQVETKKEVFSALHERGFQTVISCYWLSSAGHGGPTISPEEAALLARLNIELGFDVYFLDDQEDRLV